MGDFNSGPWIIGLILYFFILFVVINQVVSAANYYGIDADGIKFNDPGFENYNANMSTPDSASASDTASMSGIKDTLSIITGIGASQINIGIPAGFVYIFSILFFWIEFIMLIWAIYMAIPFFH